MPPYTILRRKPSEAKAKVKDKELPSLDTLVGHLVQAIPEAFPSLSLHIPINHLILLKPI